MAAQPTSDMTHRMLQQAKLAALQLKMNIGGGDVSGAVNMERKPVLMRFTALKPILHSAVVDGTTGNLLSSVYIWRGIHWLMLWMLSSKGLVGNDGRCCRRSAWYRIYS